MQVPQVDFYFREGGEFVTRTSKELFAGKRVVLFALPGAFTPTCTEQMLPGYEAAYDEIRSLGVDEVYCLSMDNAFVLNAWFKDLGIEKVKPLPDGNGSWTTAVKMAVGKENVGLGVCSWRYAVVLNDGDLEFSGAEEGMRNNATDDPYEASTPEAVIAHLKGAQAGEG